VCPSTEIDPDKKVQGFNLEFRPPDPTASPYIVLGALIRAGLEGIRDQLPLPAICEGDPADLAEEERAALGITPLAATFEQALNAFETDPVARTWMPPQMLESYLSVKRTELEITRSMSPEEVCELYASVY
jgi:glutamine synthetase